MFDQKYKNKGSRKRLHTFFAKKEQVPFKLLIILIARLNFLVFPQSARRP